MSRRRADIRPREPPGLPPHHWVRITRWVYALNVGGGEIVYFQSYAALRAYCMKYRIAAQEKPR